MEVSTNYMPGDPRLIDQIVCELKSQGIFDQFRKECIADVDTKPAYQNLRQRVEGSVTGFLRKQTWRPDMNKNQVREMLRKSIYESGFLEIGVERIVDQVVNPKINSIFHPKVEDVVYRYLGVIKPNSSVEPLKVTISHEDLLPTDLEAVSPESESADKKENDNNAESQDLDDSKGDEDESPPFEPLDDQISYVAPEENSVDSHLSGISGLASHESNHSASVKTSQMELCNQDSQISQNSSESRLSIVTSEENSKIEICEDSQSKSSKSTDFTNKNEPPPEVVVQNNTTDKTVRAFDKIESSENTKQKSESSSNKNSHDNKKSDKYKSSSSTSDKQHKSRHDSKDDKNRKSKDSSSSSKDNKSSNKERDRSKYNSSSSKDRKDSKSSSSRTSEKDRSSKSDSSKDKKDKDKYKSERDKSKTTRDKDGGKDKSERKSSGSSSNNNKHSTTSTSSSSNNNNNNSKSGSRKESSSSSSSKDKPKSSSSSSYKDKSKSSSGDTKSQSSRTEKSSSDSKTNKKDDKHRMSSSSNTNKRDKDKKRDKKDDHYSSKEKKSDRRSTDRDSNDGQSSKKSYSSSTTDNSNTKQQKTNQDSTTSSSNNSGSTDSGNSDGIDVITTLKENLTMSDLQQQVKLIKPKFASNFYEAKRLMKIRKQLNKLEKHNNQLSLARFEFNQQQQQHNNNESLCEENGFPEEEKEEETNSNIIKKKMPNKSNVNVENLQNTPQNEQVDEILEITPPLKNSVITKESWDALEAKLNQEMFNVDYNSYESPDDQFYCPTVTQEPADSSTSDLLQPSIVPEVYQLTENTTDLKLEEQQPPSEQTDVIENSTKEEAPTTTNEIVSDTREEVVVSSTNHSVEECKYLEGCEVSSRYLDTVTKAMLLLDERLNNISKRIETLKSPTSEEKTEIIKKKRKWNNHEQNNNGKNVSPTQLAKKIKKISPRSTATNKGNKDNKYIRSTDISPNDSFSLPLSPADSDKSSDKKEESVDVSMKSKPKRTVANKANQKYSVNDLYKPRPTITRRNNRGLVNK